MTEFEFFAPGPIELLVIGFLCFASLIVPVGVVIAVLLVRRRSRNNPNLRPCRDCGRPLSIRAASCPHCGCPMKDD
jgi:hypothetical protein